MSPQWNTAIGAVAGFCTTCAMLPQIHSIWRRKSARDVSLGMFLIFGFGLLLWLIYGVSIRSAPVIATNGATLVLSLIILAMKLTYDRRT